MSYQMYTNWNPDLSPTSTEEEDGCQNPPRDDEEADAFRELMEKLWPDMIERPPLMEQEVQASMKRRWEARMERRREELRSIRMDIFRRPSYIGINQIGQVSGTNSSSSINFCRHIPPQEPKQLISIAIADAYAANEQLIRERRAHLIGVPDTMTDTRGLAKFATVAEEAAGNRFTWGWGTYPNKLDIFEGMAVEKRSEDIEHKTRMLREGNNKLRDQIIGTNAGFIELIYRLDPAQELKGKRARFIADDSAKNKQIEREETEIDSLLREKKRLERLLDIALENEIQLQNEFLTPNAKRARSDPRATDQKTNAKGDRSGVPTSSSAKLMNPDIQNVKRRVIAMTPKSEVPGDNGIVWKLCGRNMSNDGIKTKYYKCMLGDNCPARKHVKKKGEKIVEIVYLAEDMHNHPLPNAVLTSFCG